MKAIFLSLLFISSSSAAAVPSKVSYDGYKVVRVKSSPEVESIIQDHSLATWNGAGRAYGQIDVVVPPGVQALDGMDSHVMHEDLGASIAVETDYQAYIRTLRPYHLAKVAF